MYNNIRTTGRRRSLSEGDIQKAFGHLSQHPLTGSIDEIPFKGEVGSIVSDYINIDDITNTRTGSFEGPIISRSGNISDVTNNRDGNDKKKDFKKRRKIQHNYHDHANDDEAIYSKSPIVSKGGVTIPFPLKLHNMLEYISKCEPKLANIVSWQPHGRCFLVRDISAFVNDVLPHFFQQRKYASFQRQLNLYGFSRITKGPDRGSYYHELFLRSKQALCRGINRMKVKGTGSRMGSNPKQEPNFYQMTCMPMSSFSSTGHSAKLARNSVKTSTASQDERELLPGRNVKSEELEPEPLRGSVSSSSNYSIVTSSLDPVSISQNEQISRMAKSELLEQMPLPPAGNVLSSCTADYDINIPMPRNNNSSQTTYEPSSSQTQVFESDDHNISFVFNNMPFYELKGGGRRHSLMDASRRASMMRLQRQEASDVTMDDALLHATRPLSIQHTDDNDNDQQQDPNTTNNQHQHHERWEILKKFSSFFLATKSNRAMSA